eukprot:265761_1
MLPIDNESVSDRELKFVNEKEAQKFQCGICLAVVRSPVFTSPCSNHLFCDECFQSYIKGNGNIEYHKCPTCRIAFKSSDVQSCNFVQKQVNSLQVYCSNYNNKKACNWTGDYGKLPLHITRCQFEELMCHYCFSVLKSHEEKECEEIEIKCPFHDCHFEGQRKAVNYHIKETHQNQDILKD